MLTNIILLKYNNYHNRVIKREESLSQYLAGEEVIVYNNYNFFKGDGIDASIILNDNTLTNGPSTQNIDIRKCDYLLEIGEMGRILSRWFIMELKDIRAGQYNLTLRRDVIVDNYDEVLDATTFIDKATVPNTEDIAIYNTENMSFNMIKKDETLIQDETEVAWIIGYLSPTTGRIPAAAGSGQTQRNITVSADGMNVIRTSTLEAWEYGSYVNGTYRLLTDLTFTIDVNQAQSTTGTFRYTLSDNAPANVASGPSGRKTFYLNDTYQRAQLMNYLMSNKTSLNDAFLLYNTIYKQNDISHLKGQVLQVQGGNQPGFYTLDVTDNGIEETTVSITLGSNTSNAIGQIIGRSGLTGTYSTTPGSYATVKATYRKLSITMTLMSVDTLTTWIPETANVLMDAPYKMFAIPYGPIRGLKAGMTYTTTFDMSKVQALAIASAIATEAGSQMYDLQLLPFCPYRNGLSGIANTINLPAEGPDLKFIKDSNGFDKGFILFPRQSSFTFDTPLRIQLPETVEDLKVMNQCDAYRLVSPNYAAAFDFNPVRNGGVSHLNVDCTYKPGTPYIHINPDFGKLYGSDFNDTRGLIFQGDFSIPYTNDKWIEYQLQNKNYLNAFNRNIESLELQRKWGLAQDIVGATAGTGVGVAGGAALGGVGGAIAGGVLSAAAGAADVFMSQRLRKEAIDLSKDQFNYQLQNIQAMPQTLAKVSSYDYNNKIFPVMEHYSCTEQEKDIFKDAMKYQGMTIGRVGHIRDYIKDEVQFIRGTLIRSDITGDNHMTHAVAQELEGGLYL